VIFKVTITSKCSYSTLIPPSEPFDNTWNFINENKPIIRSFDLLQDDVLPQYPDGTFFCGPRDYEFTVTKFNPIDIIPEESRFKVKLRETEQGLFNGNEILLEMP